MSIGAIRKALGLVKLVGPIDWEVAKAKCKELLVAARKNNDYTKAADYSAIKQEIKKHTKPKYNRCIVCDSPLSASNMLGYCSTHSPRRVSMREYFNKERVLTE